MTAAASSCLGMICGHFGAIFSQDKNDGTGKIVVLCSNVYATAHIENCFSKSESSCMVFLSHTVKTENKTQLGHAMVE